jgi:hypothetical protein
LPKFY